MTPRTSIGNVSRAGRTQDPSRAVLHLCHSEKQYLKEKKKSDVRTMPVPYLYFLNTHLNICPAPPPTQLPGAALFLTPTQGLKHLFLPPSFFPLYSPPQRPKGPKTLFEGQKRRKSEKRTKPEFFLSRQGACGEDEELSKITITFSCHTFVGS